MIITVYMQRTCRFFDLAWIVQRMDNAIHRINHFIIIKVSGNKLIKTIRYPHLWRYDIFTRYRWFRRYQVCTYIRWCIIETSSGLPRKSSAIFGNLRTFSEILGKCLGTFVWPSEQLWKIFGKWSEIFGKSSKTPSSVCLYNKKNITRELEDMNFMFSW